MTLRTAGWAVLSLAVPACVVLHGVVLYWGLYWSGLGVGQDARVRRAPRPRLLGAYLAVRVKLEIRDIDLGPRTGRGQKGFVERLALEICESAG